MAPSIKNEVRILGLDSCGLHSTIGTVVRGGLYLDGVLNFGGNHDSNRLAERILDSRYFPELRFIMVHQRLQNGREVFETEKVEKITRLPVLEIRRNRPVKGRREYSRSSRAGKNVYAWSKLDPVTMKRLLDLSWAYGIFPEPLRIAHLLAKADIRRTGFTR